MKSDRINALPGPRRIAVLVAAIALVSGCSLQRMALDQTAGILKNAQAAFEREWDYALAAPALENNVKLVEGFLQSGKDNQDLLELAAKGYTSYAMLVLEDRLEQQQEEDSPEATKLRMRASEMYMRGHRYGLRLLEARRPGFIEAFKKGRDALDKALQACEQDDAFALVWAAMPLASAINLRRDDVAMIAHLSKAKVLIKRALQLDEGYYHAAPHLILGGMLGGVSKMFGGDPKRARHHFERALKLTRRRFLLIHVLYAQTLAVQLQQEKLFRSLLQEVLSAKLEIFPEQKLANVVAKRKARRLLERVEELF